MDVCTSATAIPEVSVEEAVQVASLRAELRRFLHLSEQTAREAGLTPRQHLLLLMVKGAPDHSHRATVTDLCERMQLAQSTVTELVDRAVEAGLVAREHSLLDARVSFVQLTPTGERRLARVFTSLFEERAQLLRAIESVG
ncbi:MAG TPA: MarR family winged helix-turn-helix transcriptional regulator [Gaiellaceae bacterium]|nr:MarR family winged helix-turn-helix transcriptional regulator [Gaiellaceae bacterium]